MPTLTATLQKPQTPVTHCSNCPLNHNGICTAPRSGYPIQPDMPAGKDCHRDIEALGQRDTEYKEAKAQAKSNYAAYWTGSISASVQRDVAAGRVAEAIAPEPPRFTDDLTLVERRKAAAFLAQKGRNVDPADVLELRLCPQNVRWGKGQFWFVIRNAHAPLSPDLFPAEISEFEAFKAPVQEPVTKLPVQVPANKIAYLKSLNADPGHFGQNRVAAIFTMESTPRMRAVTICYRADYTLVDGRKGVMFYEHGKAPIEAIKALAGIPVWVVPVGMHPRYKTWRVELICDIKPEQIAQAA